MVVDRQAGDVEFNRAGRRLLGNHDRDGAALDAGPEREPAPASQRGDGIDRGGPACAQNASLSWASNQSRVSGPMCFATTLPSARMTQVVGSATEASYASMRSSWFNPTSTG